MITVLRHPDFFLLANCQELQRRATGLVGHAVYRKGVGRARAPEVGDCVALSLGCFSCARTTHFPLVGLAILPEDTRPIMPLDGGMRQISPEELQLGDLFFTCANGPPDPRFRYIVHVMLMLDRLRVFHCTPEGRGPNSELPPGTKIERLQPHQLARIIPGPRIVCYTDPRGLFRSELNEPCLTCGKQIGPSNQWLSLAIHKPLSTNSEYQQRVAAAKKRLRLR